MLKKLIIASILIMLSRVCLAAPKALTEAQVNALMLYGIVWTGTPSNICNAAKNLRHRTMAVTGNPSNYSSSTFTNIDYMCADTVLNAPAYYSPGGMADKMVYVNGLVGGTGAPYSAARRAWMEQRYTWKNNNAFPSNLATGFHQGSGASLAFEGIPNLQNKWVADQTITDMIAWARAFDNSNPYNFHFAGLMWDTPRIHGDWETNTNVLVYLGDLADHYNGTDNAYPHGTVTNDFATWELGGEYWYKEVIRRFNIEFGTGTWAIVNEPYRMWHATAHNQWYYGASSRAEAEKFIPEMTCNESSDFDWITNHGTTTGSLNMNGTSVPRRVLGTTEPNSYSEDIDRRFASYCMYYGHWFTWYGRYGGTGNMPSYMSVGSVPPRLIINRATNMHLYKLNPPDSARSLTTVNGTQAAFVNTGTYTAGITNNVTWSFCEDTIGSSSKRILACFHHPVRLATATAAGSVTIPNNMQIDAVYQLNQSDYSQGANVTANFSIVSNRITPSGISVGYEGIPYAIYVSNITAPTYQLSVASSNPASGVIIGAIPNDNGGNGTGTTGFNRTYDEDTSVTLTAPLAASGNDFQKWQLNGSDYSFNRIANITVGNDGTMTAVYVAPPTPTPTPTSSGGCVRTGNNRCELTGSSTVVLTNP